MNLPKPKNLNVEKYIGGLSKIKKINKPIKLSANESALGASPKAIRAYNKDKNNFFHYPETESNSLREVISKKFKINYNRIICGSGSDQIFDFVCKTFLKPKDEVIVSEFGFIMHRIYASLHGSKVILAKEKNYRVSIDEVLKKVSKRTKMVFIANPNNPTGTYLSKNEILYLRKNLRSDILLVIDDAYSEFMNQKNYRSGLDLFKESKNVLITRTFSKIYGLAGLRLGWGYSSKNIINALNKIKPPFNVNRAALAAGVEALKDNGWIKKAKKHNTTWSKKIFSVLKKNKVITNQPTANFFLMHFNKTKLNSDQVFKRLTKERLILRKMNQYKITNSLRLTVGNEKANKHFIKAIVSILK